MSETKQNFAERLSVVRLLAMDVDGVLTDGSLTLGGAEGETKRFHVQDGLGIQLVRHGGLRVAWISGRQSAVVERRAEELGIDHLYQKVTNKSVPLAELRNAYALTEAQIAYIGDDVNDLPAFGSVGVRFAPANAVPEIKGAADFVTEREGGQGAVREVCDTLLKAQGVYNDALTVYLAALLQGQ